MVGEVRAESSEAEAVALVAVAAAEEEEEEPMHTDNQSDHVESSAASVLQVHVESSEAAAQVSGRRADSPRASGRAEPLSSSLSQMDSSDGGLPQELMSSERDAGEMVSGATTLMVTGLTPEQLSVAGAADDAVQQAAIRAVLQAAGQAGKRGGGAASHCVPVTRPEERWAAERGIVGNCVACGAEGPADQPIPIVLTQQELEALVQQQQQLQDIHQQAEAEPEPQQTHLPTGTPAVTVLARRARSLALRARCACVPSQRASRQPTA